MASVTASLLGPFSEHFSSHCPRSVLCLQEAFTKTAGLIMSTGLQMTLQTLRC